MSDSRKEFFSARAFARSADQRRVVTRIKSARLVALPHPRSGLKITRSTLPFQAADYLFELLTHFAHRPTQDNSGLLTLESLFRGLHRLQLPRKVVVTQEQLHQLMAFHCDNQGHIDAMQFDLLLREQLLDFAQRRMLFSCIHAAQTKSDESLLFRDSLRLYLMASRGSHIHRNQVCPVQQIQAKQTRQSKEQCQVLQTGSICATSVGPLPPDVQSSVVEMSPSSSTEYGPSPSSSGSDRVAWELDVVVPDGTDRRGEAVRASPLLKTPKALASVTPSQSSDSQPTIMIDHSELSHNFLTEPLSEQPSVPPPSPDKRSAEDHEMEEETPTLMPDICKNTPMQKSNHLDSPSMVGIPETHFVLMSSNKNMARRVSIMDNIPENHDVSDEPLSEQDAQDYWVQATNSAEEEPHETPLRPPTFKTTEYLQAQGLTDITNAMPRVLCQQTHVVGLQHRSPAPTTPVRAIAMCDQSEQRRRRSGKWIEAAPATYSVSISPQLRAQPVQASISASLGFISPTLSEQEFTPRSSGSSQLQISPDAIYCHGIATFSPEHLAMPMFPGAGTNDIL